MKTVFAIVLLGVILSCGCNYDDIIVPPQTYTIKYVWNTLGYTNLYVGIDYYTQIHTIKSDSITFTRHYVNNLIYVNIDAVAFPDSTSYKIYVNLPITVEIKYYHTTKIIHDFGKIEKFVNLEDGPTTYLP